jgi:uncharacterized membrane protein
MQGSHNVVNLSGRLTSILDYFKLRQSFSYAIIDNASENRACLNLIADDLGFDASKCYVLYIGYVINLIAYKVLFGLSVKAFKHELSNVTAEVVKLQT